jgi:E3 ubiquitin-protein ligase UBR3
MYNLLYYQAIVQLCLDLDDGEKQFIIENYGMQVVNVDDIGATSASLGQANSCKLGADGAKNLPTAMALVLQNLNKPDAVRFYRSHQPTGKHVSKPKLNLNDLEIQLQSLCLPFLRIAALLRYHIYHHDLPEINNPQQEFARLTYYVELVTKSMDWKDFNATKALSFVPGTEFSLPNSWCQHLLEVMMTYRQTTDLIGSQHVNWHQPRLLGLPREYERLFTVSGKWS